MFHRRTRMKNFKSIRDLVKKSLYCSISTIQKNSQPHTSPIGSVFLNSKNEGYFIEMFTQSFKDQEKNKACIMVVNTSLIFWLKSLISGRFKTPVATRLYVTIGERREISEVERKIFQKRVSPFKRLKGYKHMWSKADYVRTFTIDEVKAVSIGKMTKHLES